MIWLRGFWYVSIVGHPTFRRPANPSSTGDLRRYLWQKASTQKIFKVKKHQELNQLFESTQLACFIFFHMKSCWYSRTFLFGATGQCAVDLQRQSYQPKWPDEGTRGWASERLLRDVGKAGKASMVHFCSGALKETTWQRSFCHSLNKQITK